MGRCIGGRGRKGIRAVQICYHMARAVHRISGLIISAVPPLFSVSKELSLKIPLCLDAILPAIEGLSSQ
jgi:hypothetical protein